jgi:hypothetical protein
MSAPKLNFMTAAYSQVRFDVGVKNFHFEVFLVDSRMEQLLWCFNIVTGIYLVSVGFF